MSQTSAHALPMLLILLLPLAVSMLGCTAIPRLSHPPTRPAENTPSNWLTGAGNVALYVQVTLPEGPPRGLLYFVFGPEIGSTWPYPNFATALRRAGIATLALHPRGAGYSEGLRGDIKQYGLFLADLQLGLQHAQSLFPGEPVFLFGHSAGAALALHLAAHSTKPPAGLILVNPAYLLTYGDGMGPTFMDYVSFALNMVFRRSALTMDMNRNPSTIKHPADRSEAEAMQADALVVRHFSMRYLQAQKAVMDACATNAARIQAPLLLVQGAGDALVSPKGNEQLLAACPHPDKSRLIAHDGGHGSSAVETTAEALAAWVAERAQRMF